MPFPSDLDQLHARMAALHPRPVSAVMDQHPLQVKPDHSALECAALILRAMANWVHLLPVVDESGRLVGVVARWHLVK